VPIETEAGGGRTWEEVEESWLGKRKGRDFQRGGTKQNAGGAAAARFGKEVNKPPAGARYSGPGAVP